MFCSWVTHYMARLALTEFHFRDPETPKSENPGFRPASDVLEIGPEWRRLRRDGGWVAEAVAARETENLAVWGGESGRGSARVGKISDAERRGRQNFRNSVFHKSGPSEIFGERLRCAHSGRLSSANYLSGFGSNRS